MKKLKLMIGAMAILTASASFIYFQGCNKNDQKVASDSTSTTNTVTSTYTETDADLITVDYKDFYDALSPKGEWIKVMPDDLGINVKTTSENEHPYKSMTFTDIFGVNSAYAQETASGAFFVWKPAPELNIGVNAGAPVGTTTTTTTSTTAATPSTYVPYSNGKWVNTDNGWYFQAATPEEEIVHHYGRWNYSPTLGWVWLPGKVWSPAWVDMKKDDKYMAWAPLPFASNIVNDAVKNVVIPADRYVIVEQPHFLDPVYTYRYIAPDPVVVVSNMSALPGLVVVNNKIVNRGPEVVYVEKVTGQKVVVYPINKVVSFSDVKVKDNVIYTYTPAFKKFDIKENPNRPTKVTTFLEAREKYGNKNGDMQKMEKKNEGNKEDNKEVKKEGKEENKEMKKEQKDNKDKKEKPYKHDDGDKKTKKDDENHPDRKKVEKPNVPVEKEHKDKEGHEKDKGDHGKKDK